MLKILRNDQWLGDYAQDIKRRYKKAKEKESELTNGQTLQDFACGHLYYGIHRTKDGWTIRDWAPNARAIYLVGNFNDWEEQVPYALNSIGNGNWELKLPKDKLKHGYLYAFSMHWEGGHDLRIPAWSTYVVQDENTKMFSAQIWNPIRPHKWKNKVFPALNEAPIIYECHIGMAGEDERVHTYNEFKEKILPRVKEMGYNTIQLMAIQEHPYYGSFGYHVSSFFAPSSRFGTPKELKELIDEAHSLGIAVIMDLVHSHAVRNEREGLGKYDGTRYQFFHDGARGEHPAWDSFCFDYNKNEVLHFLLSNLRFWLEEYQFDGFRFDGITSMIYHDHGLGKAFTSYQDYFNPNVDEEATTYLYLANKLIQSIKPGALSIAEEMSGMPGLACPVEDGGFGFNYRMAMGVPDYWIKLIKEKKDEDWDVGHLFYELTAKRMDEKVVSYAESHDQALVGDKTIIFRLIDKEMYFSMRKDQENLIVDRGVALHKMIRLITASTAGGAYLTFMGNEFGHPEWVDFPREGNNWSHQHARRLWSLIENKELRFHLLDDFEKEMIQWLRKNHLLKIPEVYCRFENKADQVIAIQRGKFLLVFNFNPTQSFTSYGIPVESKNWKIVFNSDESRFGGMSRIDNSIKYKSNKNKDNNLEYLELYIPTRTAIVLETKR